MYPYMKEHKSSASSAIWYNYDHARDEILKKDPKQIARDAEVDFNDVNFNEANFNEADLNEANSNKTNFTFLSLNQEITVSYPECKATFAGTDINPDHHWHLPILHYLAMSDGTPLSGEYVPIRYLDQHIAHPELFEHETGAKIARKFDGKDMDILKQTCIDLGGELQESSADLSFRLNFLPRFPIYIRLFMSDDEFPGSGKMMFDKNSFHYLHEMDLHCIGPLIVAFLSRHYQYLESL